MIASAAVLSSCAPGYGIQTITPPVIPYTLEVQHQALKEIEFMGPPCPRDAVYGGCSAVHRLVKDYGLTRDRIRALNGWSVDAPQTDPREP